MRTCAAEGCGIGFEPISPIQLYCSKRCKGREGVRRMRAKRKNGGNGGPGGNGGGGLVEVIVTNDPQATYVPDTRYRTPEVPQIRKPAAPVRVSEKRKAA